MAIHSKRSLFARASTPFAGPAATELLAERSAYGRDYLDRMSNLRVLEGLIAACTFEGAAMIRLAALREGLQAGLRDWADAVFRRIVRWPHFQAQYPQVSSAAGSHREVGDP